MGTIGKRLGGVDTYPADQHDLDTYQQAEENLDRMRIPVLLHADNPHERLYLATPDSVERGMHNRRLIRGMNTELRRQIKPDSFHPSRERNAQ